MIPTLIGWAMRHGAFSGGPVGAMARDEAGAWGAGGRRGMARARAQSGSGRRGPLVVVGAVIGTVALGCVGGPAQGGPSGAGPGRSVAPPGFWEHWGDGRGELTGYRLVQPRYGEARAGEVVLVVVTETLDPAALVKSDADQGMPVLKLNEARDFRTGVYDYNGMLTAWLALDGTRPRGLPVRSRFSLQEWCGHVFEDLVVEVPADGGDGARLRTRVDSYFEGETGTGALTLDGPVLVADAMPLLVRDLTGELIPAGTRRQVGWVDSSLVRRLHHTGLARHEATLSRSGPTTLLDGSTGHITTVEAPSGTWRWHVADDPVHSLVGWEGPDGERAVRTGSLRTAYWQQHREGDERLRAQLGLDGAPTAP